MLDQKEREKILVAMQEKLGKMKSGQQFDSNLWAPPAGRTLVRFIPYPDRDNPFGELYFHYNIGKVKMILCPQKTIGLQEAYSCPICEFAASLYEAPKGSEVSQENKNLYSKVKAKLRIYSPIVIRDKEFDENGEPKIHLWGYAPQVYTNLLELTVDPDYGIFWDTDDGRDITIVRIAPTKENTFGETNVVPKPNVTPLMKSKEQIEALLKSVPDIFKTFKMCTTEEIAEKLNSWLEPETKEEKQEERAFTASSAINSVVQEVIDEAKQNG